MTGDPMTKDTPGTVEAAMGWRERAREIITLRVCSFVGHYGEDREELLDALAALSASPPVWQPIETAERRPRPGNTVLGVPIYALIPYRPSPQWTVAWWDEAYKCFRHVGEDGPDDIQPTRWMPIPAPPATGGEP